MHLRQLWAFWKTKAAVAGVAGLIVGAAIGSAGSSTRTISNAAAPTQPVTVTSGTRTVKQVVVHNHTVVHTHTVTVTSPSSTPPAVASGEETGSDEVGSPSHATDSEFCQEHECIGSFETEQGTVVKCGDGSYSHAGGISGACSHHGGEA